MYNNDVSIFNERIKELREELGLSQCDLAIKINRSNTTVSAWECGRTEPDFGTLIKLADEFNVTTDYLLGREN